MHTVDPETENVCPPSFVLALTVTDDLSRLLAESESVFVNKVLTVCRTAMVKDIVHLTDHL